MLADALNMNNTLEILSLNYCGLTTAGSHAVLEIIIYSKSELKEFYLKGNPFKDLGVKEILHATKINQNLEILDLADTQCSEEVLPMFGQLLAENSSILHLSLAHNCMTKESGTVIINALSAVNEEGIRFNETFQIIDLPDQITAEHREEIEGILKTNKPKRGKKGKGGKKGKKGKKKK